MHFTSDPQKSQKLLPTEISCYTVCSKKLLKTPIVLRGPRIVVHINESLFSHKCKAHRGRPLKEDVWVFGIVDTFHTPALGYMRVVLRRDARTLLLIIQTTVAPGSIVHSDEWAAYRSIQSTTGLTHRTVNYSLHFVDPTTGVHTNNVESYWNRAKLKLKAMRGCTKDQLPSYLDEFMLKERFGRDQDDGFLNMLKHIARILLNRNLSCTICNISHLSLTIYFIMRLSIVFPTTPRTGTGRE